MFHMPESRFVAFAVHLFLSVFIFTCLTIFIYFILLPGFLFYSEGGITFLTIIGSVDVVLGPLITLIIYKKVKPSIKLDLTIIALLQIAALIYGLHALWSVRPIAVFYTGDSYHVVYQSTFKEPTYSDISKIPELNRLKPTITGISTPTANLKVDALVFTYVIQTGKSYFSQPELYKKYQDMIPNLINEGLSIEDAISKKIIKQDSKLAKLDRNRYRVFRFVGSLNSGYLLIDITTGKFIETII